MRRTSDQGLLLDTHDRRILDHAARGHLTAIAPEVLSLSTRLRGERG